MILHSDWTFVEQAFGCSLPDRFLMALRSFDNTHSVTPFIVESRGRRFGLFIHVEKGNVAAAHLPANIVPVFYQPYFNFDPGDRPPHVHLTLEDALAAIADGDRCLSVDGSLPMALTRRLARRFDLSLPAPWDESVTIRRITRADILARHMRDRPRGAEIARKLLERSRHRDAIAPFLAPVADDRFMRLDALLSAAGAKAVLARSIVNVQELAGVPMRGRDRPLAAIYRPDGDVLVIERGPGADGPRFPSLRDALREAVPTGPLAVEEDDLETSLALAFGLDERDTLAGDILLRRWRDEGTRPDLPFYVITTRASRHAIDAALAFTAARVEAGLPVDEMDGYAVYLQAMQDFFRQHAPDFVVARTLTNYHAGARTIFPSNAAPFAIDKSAGTLKIDVGCLMVAPDGMMLGCSDIARTLCFDEDSRRYADLFETGVRDVLIPACRAGTKGADIHALGVRFVTEASDRFSGNSLFHDIGYAPDAYARDLGHLLGRNNLTHLKFTASESGVLKEGMIACCEYQWPVGRHAVGYEDTCLVTSSGGLNLTVD